MRFNILPLIVILTVNWTCVNAETLTNPFDTIKSSDPANRSQGFNDMIEFIPIPGRNEYGCEFKVSDTIRARKALIELLRRENHFDFDKFYRNKYGVEFSSRELYNFQENDKASKYLYAREGHGIYVSELMAFIDSCEDESAVDLFPGEKTFNKYPRKSTELAMRIVEKTTTGPVNINGGILLQLVGVSAKQYRKTDKELYARVKTWLIKLTDDDNLCNMAASVMGNIGDTDFIPILEKISQYDDSRGKRIYFEDTNETIVSPISLVAKSALKKIPRK